MAFNIRNILNKICIKFPFALTNLRIPHTSIYCVELFFNR